jgi:uncharacterized membrane protein YhaH (DUF805 family)
MRGEVIDVNGISGDGLISGDDGARYTFTASSSRVAVRVGDKVDFVGNDGVATDIMKLAGSAAPRAEFGSMHTSAPMARSRGIDWSTLLWSGEGRIRRSHFWAAWGVIFAANLLLSWIPLIGFLVGLALIWPNIAIQTKRLHDMGKTGWLQLIPYGLMLIAVIITFTSIGLTAISNPDGFSNGDTGAMFAAMGPMFIAVALVMLGSLGFLIWIGSTEGQPGRNQYGPSPKFVTEEAADTFS